MSMGSWSSLCSSYTNLHVLSLEYPHNIINKNKTPNIDLLKDNHIENYVKIKSIITKLNDQGAIFFNSMTR